MDYDDNDFQKNQNLNLAGEAANSKFPQSYSLPKFDFDDSHLRFDGLAETETFLNQDSNWIEDFSRGSSGLVFSSVATESCAVSRHTNVWSEATSLESVEMLLNSVGQDEAVVKENTVELGCTMEQLEAGQTNHEDIVMKEGTSDVQVHPSPSVDDSPGDSSVVKRDSGLDHTSEVISDHTSKADSKEMELSDVTVLEREDQALSAQEVVGLDVSGTQDVLVSGDLPTASEHECSIQTETHTQILRVETSESEQVSQMDSIVESTQGDVSKKGDDDEGSALMANLKQSMELAETVVSEVVEYVSRDSASKLVELKSQPDTIPTDMSGTTIGGEGCEASISKDEVPVSLTSSTDFHMVNISSDASEKVSFSDTEKVSSGEPENSQAVPPMLASSSGSHLDQLARKHTEDTQLSTQVVEVCTASEGSKDATDADAAGQVLLQQSEETILEEILVTEVVNVPETQSILDNNCMSEKPNTSSLANLESEAGKDGREEGKAAASGGIKPAGTPGSHPTGDAMEIGDSCASTSSEPFVKSHVTPVINASTDLGTPGISFSAVKTSEVQLDKTKTNTSSDANELVSFSETEKISSGEHENSDPVPPVDASSPGSHLDQQAKNHTSKADSKEMELSDVTVLEREDQALSAHEVVALDVPGNQDVLVSGALTTASEHECSIQTETHTQILRMETSESKHVSQMDSIVESTQGDESKKGDDDEGSALRTNLEQSMELAETVVSEVVEYVSRDSATKLVELKSQPATIPTGKSGTKIDGEECEASISQDGAPAISLTSSIDIVVNTSSDANEQVSFSETEKISSGEHENSKPVPPVDASSSGSHLDQQAKNHTEDTQQSTEFVKVCTSSEGSKDAAGADVDQQVLLKQSEETILEEKQVTEVVNVPETQSIMDNNGINGKPNTSSLANLGSEAGKDGQEEGNAAAYGGTKLAGSHVSHPTSDVIEIGDSCASTSSEPFVQSHVTPVVNPSTDLETPGISFPAVETSELQLDKTKINSVKKSVDPNVSSFMSAESPVMNTNETLSSGLNLTSGPRKAGEISKVVNFSQATLVSPVVVGSPSSPSLEKIAAKSSRTKSERKPRGTPKSAGKETSRKGGNSVKGATPTQLLRSGTNAVNQSSASSIQITQSSEKQKSLQAPALNSFWTSPSTPTASLPDLNSSAISSILRRPFTDLQQVQLRAQIFVYGALIQGVAPDEAYMISAFGGPDGGKGTWEKAWRSCTIRAQKMHISTPETPLLSRQGKTETFSVDHTSSIQRGSAAGHQPLLSSSHAHPTPSLTNIVGQNTPWMSPLPYHNPWLASPQTSGLGGGSRFPVFPITETVKLTPTKESPLPYSGGKHVLGGTSSNVFKGTTPPEPASTVVAPALPSTGTKTRKRKKMPVSVESGPSVLNSLNQTEVVASPHVSMSTPIPFNAITLPNVASITTVPVNLVSTFPGKKMKSSLLSPVFGGNLVPEVKQRSVLSVDTVDKLNEAKMHAEDASVLATAAVSHSEYVWKQLDQQRHAGLQSETQDRLALAAVAIAAAAAVAKAAAAAANVAANAALQAKLMAEEASLLNGLPKSNDVIIQGQGTPPSILKGEGAVVNSSLVLSAAREAAKKRIEAATAATKRADNMDSIVKAAELASEAVSQAGILVSLGHPPSLDKLVEAGPSNYWRQAQESVEAQPDKVGVLEKENMATSDGAFANPRNVPTQLDGSVRMADGLVSATGKKTKGQTGHSGAKLAKNNDVVLEPEVGSKFDTQIESERTMKTANDEGIKEGSLVEVFKDGPEIKTAWYSANVLSLEDGKAYVLFKDLSVEQGTDKLKEWIALKGEGDEAPKIRTARSVTAMPYEGTRKRRRAAIGDPVWKIGDRVDSWVHDSWLEGVITEKNKNDDNTVTVHFPAQGDTLTIKAWNLRPSLEWKDGRWIECSTSGANNSSSHEGDTPKEKRPRLGAPALVSEVEDTKMKTVDGTDKTKPPQTVVLDLGVSGNTFNIGTSTREENKPGPLRMKRTGLQTQGAKVIYGVPKPGKTRKFMDVSKHYVSEANTKTGERKEPTKPLKSVVPQNPGPGSWRMPSKTVPREKQTAIPKPKTSRPAPKAKEKLGAAARIIPRKDSRNTTVANMEGDDAVDQSGENKGFAGEEQTASSSRGQDTSSLGTNNKGKMARTAGRLAKIEEDNAMADSSSKASDGKEPRRSVRRIQPTSRLLEGLQSSMMTSKIPSMSHSKSHQSKK